MDRLLNVLTGFSLLLMAMVLFSVRRAHIRVEYSVSWLGAAVTLLALSRSGWLLDHVALFLGITYAPLSLLLLVFCIFLVVIYRFSLVMSNLKDANIALSQRVAILEFRLRALDEKSQADAAR